jgi:hypothetical protein
MRPACERGGDSVAAITVHLVRPADLEVLRAINAAGLPGVTPLSTEELAALETGALRCWVAEAPEGVAGYLIAYTASDAYDGEEFAWFQRHFARFLYIDQVAIASRSRRGGIGSALYQAIADEALALGLDSLTCEVNLVPPNPVSLSFHRARGFQEVGVLRAQDGRTVALLRRALTPPATPDDAALA